ncbi:MAG: hypothetical protein ABMB14_08715 [Myxococcota bacterium]
MIEKVVVDLTGARIGLLGAVFRYEVMERLARCAEPRSVRVLAFGFGEWDLRLVLEGDPDQITNVLRGLKVGTIRAAARWGIALATSASHREGIGSERWLLDAVVWAHRAPLDAGAASSLASPWSSHRDVLGVRKAEFYDRAALDGRVDPKELARRLLSEPVPAARRPGVATGDLAYLLRIAAGVLGVLPGNRRCFRLFVHLAKAHCWSTYDIARALDLSTRRVRQLAGEVEPALGLALRTATDPQLSRVP